MAAVTIEDTNLFAYCRNNPVKLEDTSGEWVNVVIGAVVGGAISGFVSYKTGAATDEVIMSAVMGTLGGALAATGLGGVAGQAIIGATTNAIDTGYSAYKGVKSGDMAVGTALVCTALSAALGALFGGVGYEGTSSYVKSCAMVDNGMNGLKKLSWSWLTGKSLKSTTKQKATSAVSNLGTYIANTTYSTVVETALTVGTNAYGVKYTEYWLKYYC